jgi:uncharacterized protein YeaO (DUF488 family)
MLRRASLDEFRSGAICRDPGQAYLVVAMRMYPRLLSKNMIDEYQCSLSPEPRLFAEYRELCRRHDNHEIAFQEVNYEERFDLFKEGRENLARLGELSKACDVHLVCKCKQTQHCHVDLILIMARHLNGTPIQDLPFQYARFESRFAGGREI